MSPFSEEQLKSLGLQTEAERLAFLLGYFRGMGMARNQPPPNVGDSVRFRGPTLHWSQQSQLQVRSCGGAPPASFGASHARPRFFNTPGTFIRPGIFPAVRTIVTPRQPGGGAPPPGSTVAGSHKPMPAFIDLTAEPFPVNKRARLEDVKVEMSKPEVEVPRAVNPAECVPGQSVPAPADAKVQSAPSYTYPPAYPRGQSVAYNLGVRRVQSVPAHTVTEQAHWKPHVEMTPRTMKPRGADVKPIMNSGADMKPGMNGMNAGAAVMQPRMNPGAVMKPTVNVVTEMNPSLMKPKFNPATIGDSVWLSETDVQDGSLTVKLLRHQRIALDWMLNQEAIKGGGILADDQGLGKTLSAISLLLKAGPRAAQGSPVAGAFVKGGTLIVCPVAVLHQWQEELESKVAEGRRFSCYLYHGQDRLKTAEELARFDVVITTYMLVKMDLPFSNYPVTDDDLGPAVMFGNLKKAKLEEASMNRKPKGPLARIAWHRVVLDEAQNIKNACTRVSLACRDLVATYKWGLSGTPIQNRLDELFSFFRYLHVKPLNSCSRFEQTKEEIWNENPSALQADVNSIMLRRTKRMLMDGKPLVSLPDRIVNVVKVTLSTAERKFYSDLEQNFCSIFEEYYAEGSIERNRATVFTMLLRLRQACNHPVLVFGKLTEDDFCLNNKELEEDEQMAKAPSLKLERWMMKKKEAAGIASSKIRTVIKYLEEVPPDEKVLVFSQWTSMLDLLQPALNKSGICFTRLDGQMTLEERRYAIREFSEDPGVKVLLVCLMAGGVGLNLVAASRVLLVDVWWNPTSEDQAIDRAHRIGQTRAVHVTRLAVHDSIEDKVLLLQEKKREMVAFAFGDSYTGGGGLSTKDLCYLFRGS